MENTLKLIHIVAATAWFGAGIVRAVLFARVRRSNDPQRITTFFEENNFLGKAYFNVLGILTLVAGVWLVLITNWEFSEAWISIGFLGIIFGIAWGVVFYPRSSREVLEGLDVGEAVNVAAPMSRFALYANIELVVLLVVMWAMVFKPGA